MPLLIILPCPRPSMPSWFLLSLSGNVLLSHTPIYMLGAMVISPLPDFEVVVHANATVEITQHITSSFKHHLHIAPKPGRILLNFIGAHAHPVLLSCQVVFPFRVLKR